MHHQHIKRPEQTHDTVSGHHSPKHAHAEKLDVQCSGLPLYLQRSQTQLLQRQPLEEEEELQTKCENCARFPQEPAPSSHAKLKIGAPNDKYEQEADRVADHVMRMPDPKVQRQAESEEEEEEQIQTSPLASTITPLIRRQAEPEEEEEEEEAVQTKSINPSVQCQPEPEEDEEAEAEKEEEEEPLQTKSITNKSTPVSAGLQNKIQSLNGGGQSLPKSDRSFFESRFGSDFSAVKIHTDSGSASLARSINAKAFTHGRNIVFAAGQYAPQTGEGKKLLAHELTHTIQQRNGTIRRDLATPLPAVTPPRRRALTNAEIQRAIRYNRRRYNAVGTRLIQDLVGSTPTGSWVSADIVAIALLQEQFGMSKDGRVGFRTFRFLVRETRRERLARTDSNCLTDLHIDQFSPQIVPRRNGALMRGHFRMRAQFPRYCGCRHFEYRQFIRGHFTVQRGRRVVDQGAAFDTLPRGRLNRGWQEDGDTTVTAVNYGYRSRQAETNDRYVNDRGRLDMRNGCRYRGEDWPGGDYTGWRGFRPRGGDILDIRLRFRGEIRRNARVVRRKWWTGLRRRFVLPR